jgi:hypothetical protein
MTTPILPADGGGRVVSRTIDVESWIAPLGVLIAVGVAQLADLVTFVRLMGTHGVAAEANPLVASGFDSLGLVPLVVGKVALVILIAAAFVLVARSRARLSTVIASAGVVAGIVGAYTNTVAL